MKSRKAKILLSILLAVGMVSVTTDCAFQRMRENLKNCEFDLDSVSVKSLSFTIHFNSFFWLIVMLHTHHSTF